MVTALRNVISFGISFGVYDFIDLQGFFGTFGILGGVTGVIGLGIIPVWGKESAVSHSKVQANSFAVYGMRIRAYFGALARM
jgi:hypothetical protein